MFSFLIMVILRCRPILQSNFSCYQWESLGKAGTKCFRVPLLPSDYWIPFSLLLSGSTAIWGWYGHLHIYRAALWSQSIIWWGQCVVAFITHKLNILCFTNIVPVLFRDSKYDFKLMFSRWCKSSYPQTLTSSLLNASLF